ncbi:nitrogen fixation protein NifQ [Thiobacillus sp.]|uniref:nitrogen fixation protein NifQ n=1 Tax=Thiobacillus sp. TaxID=924 RepID=UPI0025CBB1C1|nr:nitrogen fixation protein NifQ [Thiobacillus sp.]
MSAARMDAPARTAPETLRSAYYDSLMAHAAGLPNDDLFARMIASQASGSGALPPGLGLFGPDYVALLARHFPDAEPPAPADRPAFDPEGMPERDDLLALLLDHIAGHDDSERRMAEIVVVACMGGDHLWQDLGLWSRADLSRLMNENFPALAAQNDRDMKWKKFLYRQICEREGIHVCPAPACQICVDYAKCFSSEG